MTEHELARLATGPVAIAFAVALGVVLATTPLSQRLAWRWGFVDRPARHKAHRAPTPMLGGVALVLAVGIGLLVVARMGTDLSPWPRIMMAGLVLAVLGAWDDRRPLPVRPRLAIQILVVGALAWTSVRLTVGPEWISILVTMLWLLLMTNAVNLLDNMDGVAAAVSAIAAGAFVMLGGGAPAAALVGACLGFLWFNRPVALVFLGDAGRLPLGLWLGVLGADLASTRGALGAALLPVLVLAVPLFDTALVSWSRLRRGLNPMTTPGLDHVAHRLRRLGLSAWNVVLALTAIGTAGAIVAVLLDRSGIHAPWAGGVGLACGVVVLWAALVLERPRPLGTSRQAADKTSP